MIKIKCRPIAFYIKSITKSNILKFSCEQKKKILSRSLLPINQKSFFNVFQNKNFIDVDDDYIEEDDLNDRNGFDTQHNFDEISVDNEKDDDYKWEKVKFRF